jgi:hypothetical protein
MVGVMETRKADYSANLTVDKRECLWVGSLVEMLDDNLVRKLEVMMERRMVGAKD